MSTTGKTYDSNSFASKKKKINSRVMLDKDYKAKLSSGTIEDLAELTKGATSKIANNNKFSGTL
jgi:hypothetical protein